MKILLLSVVAFGLVGCERTAPVPATGIASEESTIASADTDSAGPIHGFFARCAPDGVGTILPVHEVQIAAEGRASECASMVDSVRFGDRVRFHPKKDDVSFIEFECSAGAELFFNSHADERVLLVAGGVVMSAPHVIAPQTNPCALMLGEDVGEAIEFCERIALKMGSPAEACLQPCSGDEPLCVPVKS